MHTFLVTTNLLGIVWVVHWVSKILFFFIIYEKNSFILFIFWIFVQWTLEYIFFLYKLKTWKQMKVL